MNSIKTLARLTMAIAVLAGLVACADAPSAPVAATQSAALAASFDALAQEAAMSGAMDRSDDWRWVAFALRHGIQPSRIEIWTYGKMEDYDAFVRAVEAPMINTAPWREPGHTMLAWQKHGEAVADHALRLWSPGDNGRIVPHVGIHSELPIGAHADYFEKGSADSPWAGFKGIAQVQEHWAGARCSMEPNPELALKLPEGWICQKANFNVRFESTFEPRLYEGVPESRTMNMWMAEQKVVGVKLTPGR